jgi:hypothetical protein
MLPNLIPTLTAAIRNRRCVTLRYDGRKETRTVEPHLLFRATADPKGDVVLVAYQVRGYHSGQREGSFWRPFGLNKIDGLTVTQELFVPRLAYGYEKVLAAIKNEILVRIDPRPTEYTFLGTGIYGPPAP